MQENKAVKIKSKSLVERIIIVLIITIIASFSYLLAGLYLKFGISYDIYSFLSLQLILFALFQAIAELKIKYALIFLLISYALGLLFEIIGTNTGIPFGKYVYSDLLGPKILNVPFSVPFVWFVIIYLSFSITIKIAYYNKLAFVFLASLGVVGWDLFIDPMFVSYGYWKWLSNNIPMLSGIPITNFVGWYIVALTILSIFSLFLKKAEKNFEFRYSKYAYIIYIVLIIDGILANIKLNNFGSMTIGVLVSSFL